LAGKHWRIEERVDTIGKLKEEIQGHSRHRKEWVYKGMCSGMRRKNVRGTGIETLAKNRQFYCMN